MIWPNTTDDLAQVLCRMFWPTVQPTLLVHTRSVLKTWLWFIFNVLTNLCNKCGIMNYIICIPMDVYVPIYGHYHDNLAHVACRHPLQMQLVWPAQADQTSTIAETDN